MSSIVGSLFRTMCKVRKRLNPKLRDVTISAQRAKAEALSKWMRIPKNVMIESEYAENVPVEWISDPAAKSSVNVILYLHGGAYTTGVAVWHKIFAAALSKASRARVLIPDYRLAPKFVFPAALDDIIVTYCWLLNNNVKASRIIIVGDSAGGGLNIATAISLRERLVHLPAAIVCISPWVDLLGTDETRLAKANADIVLTLTGLSEAAHLYAEKHRLANPLISPLYGNFQGLPPLLIHVGTEEILLSDSHRLAQRAELAGVTTTIKEWDGMWHGWNFLGSILPESKKSVEEIGLFCQKYFE